MESVTKLNNVVVKSSSRFAVLPVEIISQILLSLDPRELILLQRVSKQFHAIINDRILWRAIYADAHLSRPPGPFDWQSTSFLQHTLVHSARLEKCWTSQPISVVSTHSLTLGSYDGRKCQMVCGRWLIFPKERRRLLSRDMDTGFERTLCWWIPECIRWSATWRVASESTEGRNMVYVLLCAGKDSDNSGYEVHLLEFQTDDDSGHLSGPVTYRAPMIYRAGYDLEVEGGNTPFVFICVGPRRALACALVFDTQSHVFYQFPPETDQESPFYGLIMPRYDQLVLTTTHIIVSINVIGLNKHYIRAYTIPDDSDTHMLCLSHETITHDQPGSWSLLRNSSTGPINGSTRVRLLGTSRVRPNGLRFRCVDFTLPRVARDHVLPISIDIQPVLTFVNARFGDWSNVVEPSVHGLIRGLCVVYSDLGPDHICKFSIDATGEQCVGVAGAPSLLWPGLGRHYWQIDSFDGSRGRMCYTENMQGDVTLAMVLNLA